MSARSVKPNDGRCQCCNTHVGRHQLVWDHCHDCGLERGWLCDPCNTALTEHVIYHWDKATDWLFQRHRCAPRLLDPGAPAQRRDFSLVGETRSLHLGQGPRDPRTVRVSNKPGWVTLEQLAVFAGVTPGTVRDYYTRRRRSAAAQWHNKTMMVTYEDAIEYIRERNKAA